MGKRELIALLNLSSWCLVMAERLFLAVPRGCLQFVIVVFPDHTHLLFLFGMPLFLQIFEITFIITYDKYKNKIHIYNKFFSILLVRLATQSVNHTSLKT